MGELLLPLVLGNDDAPAACTRNTNRRVHVPDSIEFSPLIDPPSANSVNAKRVAMETWPPVFLPQIAASMGPIANVTFFRDTHKNHLSA
jgi:hypothetical protein